MSTEKNKFQAYIVKPLIEAHKRSVDSVLDWSGGLYNSLQESDPDMNAEKAIRAIENLNKIFKSMYLLKENKNELSDEDMPKFLDWMKDFLLSHEKCTK